VLVCFEATPAENSWWAHHTFQDKMFHQFGMSFYVMTFHVSAVSCVLSFGGLVLQQQLLSSFTFVSSHPEVLRDMLLLAVAVRAPTPPT
jgi:hypothetical protein